MFIVVGLEGRRLILVNGGNRSLAKPKLKHYKHVKPLGHIMSEVEVNSIIRADIDCREKDTFLRKKIDLFLDKIKCEKEVSDAQRRSN
ncbi:MAG TPA: hypothetical protein GXX72_01820 [Clostridiaceae bacterium]|nr:hypothetical protein [Clostridiaceae bacterium]